MDKKNKQIKVFKYKDKQITFDFGDGNKMINATEMVKAFDKRLDNFMRLKQTKEFILTLKSVPSHVREHHIIKTVRGGKYESRGTWVNDILALKLAAWLSPQFEIWIYTKIKELLINGSVQINPAPISDKELLFYLQKIVDNNIEASQLAEHIIERKKGLNTPPKD